MRQYRDDAIAAIESGKQVCTGKHSLVMVDPEDRLRLPGRICNGRGSAAFRPGLTVLVNHLRAIHTVTVIDLSRLSRSDALTLELMKRFSEEGVRIERLLEDSGTMADEEGTGALTERFLSWAAEHRLREILLGAMRGYALMLESGRPHARIPEWLERDKKGSVRLKSREAQRLRRAIDLYLETRSYAAATRWINEDVRAAGEQSVLYYTTLRQILRNPALIGKQSAFGKLWDVFPPLIDERTWSYLQALMARVQTEYRSHHTRTFEHHLLSGLLRCSCGRPMKHTSCNGCGQYVCSIKKELRQRQAQEGNPLRHVVLNDRDVEGWISDMIERQPWLLENRLSQSASIQKARPDAGWDEGLAAHATLALTQSDEGTRSQARSFEIATGSALLCERHDSGERTSLQAHIPHDDTEQLRQRIHRWSGLSLSEKRAVLWDTFRCLQVDGEPPHEVIRPVFNGIGGGSMAAVPLRTQIRGSKYHRRLLPLAEYVALVRPRSSPPKR